MRRACPRGPLTPDATLPLRPRLSAGTGAKQGVWLVFFKSEAECLPRVH